MPNTYKPGDQVIYTGPLGSSLLTTEDIARGGRLMTVESRGAIRDTWNCTFPGGGGRYGEEHLEPASSTLNEGTPNA